MKTSFSFPSLTRLSSLVVLCALAVTGLINARVLDDFNDNAKTGWTDFTFLPNFGLPTETGGRFNFTLPPAGQDIFTASQKTSELFELKEGRTLEFRVDLISSSGQDSFAVLAFIPNTGGNNPGTLAGYGLAKDIDDVLITKGILKYFVADDGPSAELKNENVTLVLSLTVSGGNVIITGRVLDKDNANAVLWERTVVDTPAADVLARGTDSPAAPYITTGYFTLYCYQQFRAPEPYSVTYDNAEVFVLDETVLDDFNDNAKTGWTDFTFLPNFGLPTETGGRFNFTLPPAGQDIFTASQKTTRLVELVEGERVELQVDLVSSSGQDSFAVLAFIPNTGGNNPGTLAGYGLAKDIDDVLITKGILKYFVADDGPSAELKNENVTLVLSLTVSGGNVIITGRVLDKDNGNAVLWERTVVDTPAADVLARGTDSPAAPYITTGYFTLYCYQQFRAPEPYSVTYDNAILRAAPVAANTPPLIQQIQPTAFASFLPAPATVSFQALDDQALADDKFSITVNGTVYTTANGLTITGSGTSRTASVGGLVADTDYTAVLRVEDSEGLFASRTIHFDTFAPSRLTIEVEDYNFGGGQFIDNPVPAPEGFPVANGYAGQTGIPGTDFFDTRTTPRFQDTMYRPDDPVRMARSRDFARARHLAAGGTEAGVYDYDVGDIAAGEWMNYTRTFPAGTYEVYLRQALANMALGESVLELVTSDRSLPEQTTRALGSFQGTLTGFQYRNFPLVDGSGKHVVLRLNGVTTLRLRQVTPDPGDGQRLMSYLLFLPVADPGVQRARVASVSPAPAAAVNTVNPVIEVMLENQDTSVQSSSVALTVNGLTVVPQVTTSANGASVRYVLDPLPPSGTPVAARVSFRDSEGTEIRSEWSFTVNYQSLNPAHRAGRGKDRGFNVRVVQAPFGSALENSLQRAEDQLAPGSSIPVFLDTTEVVQLINFSQNEPPSADGAYPDDALVPGLDIFGNGTDDIAMAITTYLELAAGKYRFGVICDDGYKIQSLARFTDVRDPPLAFHNGGPANATFDFVVPESGLYPFRMVWYERGGGAHVEWFVVNPATGERIALLNDTASPVRAFATVDAEARFNPPTISAGNLTLSWTGGGELEEAVSINGPWTRAANQTSPQTLAVGTAAGAKFFRIRQ